MTAKTDKYIESIGRRKTATARVRMTEASKESYVINDRAIEDFFMTEEERATALSPLKTANLKTIKFAITAKINGGGSHSQAEAMRLGIGRGLVEFDKELRKGLKEEGHLKRDPRAKERRKFGLKKARKAPQWSKR